MHSDKKITKEDTWRPAELTKHIREGGHGDGYVRRRDDNERKHRGGESTERRHRDPEKESRRERDKPRERESTRERQDENEKDRYADRRKQGSQDRRSDNERDKRDDREKRRERDKLTDGKRYDEDYKRRDREEKHERDKEKEKKRDKEKERDGERRNEEDRDKRREERHRERRSEEQRSGEKDRMEKPEREKERHRDKEKEGDGERRNEVDRDKRREERHRERRREERDRERDQTEKHKREREKERHRDEEKERDRERRNEEDRDKKREERHRERRREEGDREHGAERQRHEGSGERDRMEKHEKEKRDRHRERERHKDEYEDKRNDKDRRERHGDRKHLEGKEDREHKEEQRRHKEERERRHKEREYHDERRKHDSESREHRDLKGSGEEVSRHRGDRERAEWDKHKERRHREEDEAERNHHRDKKGTSDKSHKQDSKTEVANDEDLADQEYEDDFEDYEEDFEEMDESANEGEGEDEEEPQHAEEGEEREQLTAQRRKEIEAIQRAMDEENERVGTAQSTQITSREEEEGPKWSRGSENNQRRASQRGKFIDFVAAKQREVSKKVATKQKKRSAELLRLIDLDFSMTASLLDLPPVNEYDMYIRTFGTENTKQAYVQCNEDNADRDIQTEEIEVCEKWTQHPPEHMGACGDPNLSQETRNRSELSFDSQRLTAFLRSASQVMVVLLEEDRAERRSLRKPRSQTDTLSFSDGSLQLNTKLPFLYGRPISLVHFSQVQRHTMISVHSPTTKPSAVRLDSYTIICIWNIWEPSKPQKVLVYESEVQCCCFSPGKATLVFAGTSVGSVVLWDLREHAGDHYRLKIGEQEWTFRQPTFSTDAVMAGSGHFSSVTSVEVVPSAAAGGLRPEVPLLASEEESSGLSFQLASLDETGVLNFWVVVELPKADEAGSLTDLGLRPGGKVKLLHSSHLLTAERVSPRDAVKTGPLETLLLKFLPTDSNHFFIGTNMGLVNHETSHGLKAPPKFYRFQEPGVRPVEVTSIHFSPFRQHLFLVGCGDGTIRLHAVSHEQPVAEWKNSPASEPVVSLQWTQTRPSVFCVLDAASNLHIWDLLKNDTEPVVTEKLDSDRVMAMAVFGDSGQQNTYSGIALAHESGKIEMQYFARDFTVPMIAEEEKLESMMTEAF
ncbi:cytoplasmic dynein 2 intermediate chain 1 isoform X2 [Centropristis striata]|uniref:cytoplasmic dynein 2 intermediate chain 1 isoform X2 n=1 Tax=Centropristis striata TaxID=184440 RepID=UPI0027E00FA1|nr:cytoplasmic dynein 2 intermediate chain 1 isoform X2 [Centropristis striata]